MIKKVGRFLIKYEECDEEFIDNFPLSYLEEQYQRIKLFFNYPNELSTIRINFHYSKEDFEFFYGSKHENWISAFTSHKTTIHLFSPAVIEDVTIHDSNSIIPSIVHEMSHLFYGYSKLQNIELFNEGIATYFQKKECNTKINFLIKSLKSNDQKFIYNVGHLIIYNLVNLFGEELTGDKLIQFIKAYDKSYDDNKLLSLFKEKVGIDVNELVKE